MAYNPSDTVATILAGFDTRLAALEATPSGRQIFTLLGDSLIAGRGSDNNHANRTASDPLITQNAKQYVLQAQHPQKDTWITGISPIYGLDPGYVEDRIYFAENMLAEYMDLTGLPVGVIAASNGGSSLTGQAGWKPTSPYGTNLLEAKTAHNAGWAAMVADEPDAVMGGVMIDLTSNSDGKTRAERRQAWLDLIDYVRANFDGVTATTPIIIGAVCFNGTSGTERRTDAAQAASQRDFVYIQHPVYPTQAADNLHPTRSENRAWGINLATKFNMANFGDQTEPSVTNLTSQGVVVGQPFTLNVQHTGLAGDDSYGTVLLTGNDDDALFEVVGDVNAPQIVEKTPGTLAAGTYTFTLRVEDQENELGPPVVFTLTASAPVSQDVAVTDHGEVGGYDTSQFGKIILTNVALRAGDNILLIKTNGSNRSATTSVTVDGNAARQIDTSSASPANQNVMWWAYRSAIDTTAANITIDTGTTVGSGIRIDHFSVVGSKDALLDAEYLDRTSRAAPQSTKAFTIAQGNLLLTAAHYSNGAGLVIGDGDTLHAPDGAFVAASRDTDGVIQLQGWTGNATMSLASILFERA